MDSDRKIIISTFKKYKKEGLVTMKDFHVDSHSELFDKSNEKSIEVRQKGNQLFTGKNHDEKVHEEVWKFYCQSIAFAQNESQELALGYANRSALLLHLKKYKDSLLDIERALSITESSALKVKLFCRQTECFVALKDGKKITSLDRAKFWLSKVDDDNEVERLNIMINKAEIIVERNIPANLEKEKKNDISCDNNIVRVSYDERMGRGLVANRDISPGEFIYVEKFYATSVDIQKLYAYCSHCLGISWSLIPCDKCAYYMFCSEKCKGEAWEKYHEVECDAKFVKGSHLIEHACQLSIRSLIMGLREAGSIEKLDDLIYKADKHKKTVLTKFSNNSFINLYSLSYTKQSLKVEHCTKLAMDILQTLAKNTTIFNEECQEKNLVDNDDAIFIGTLLLRLLRIFYINSTEVFWMNRGCQNDKDSRSCVIKGCCFKGTSISLFTSLINHSCANNVDKFHTNDGRAVYYALKPISKNSEILTNYTVDYVKHDNPERSMMINLMMEFNCTCLACKMDWPNIHQIREQDRKFPDNSFSNALWAKNDVLLDYMEESTPTRPSKKIIRNFVKDVELLYQIVKEPTFVTEMFHEILICLIENRYCEILKVPSTC